MKLDLHVLLDQLALANQIAADLAVQFHLVIDGELGNDSLQDGPDGDVMFSDERRVVDVREETHQEPETKQNNTNGIRSEKTGRLGERTKAEGCKASKNTYWQSNRSVKPP